MPLQKQSLDINFGQGVDTQTDPNQVELGKFLSLTNSVFNKGGQLTKRNGFGNLPALPNTTAQYITTHNDNLLALGNSLQVLSTDTNQWATKGIFQDVDLNVQTLVRRASGQLTVDTAVAPNKAVCTVYINTTGSLQFVISDSITGEQIVPRVSLPGTAVMGRVIVLGAYFVVTYLVTIAGNTNLAYTAIPWANPTMPLTQVALVTDVNTLTSGYDIAIGNLGMYFSYESSAGSVRTGYVSPTLILSNLVSLAGQTADLISISIDNQPGGTNDVYVSFWSVANGNDTLTMRYSQLLTIYPSFLVPVLMLNNTVITALTSSTLPGVLASTTLFYEVKNFYSYAATTRTDYILSNTVNASGVVSVPVATGIVRSVGLASKSFIIDGKIYVLTNYAGSLQPSYFLIDVNGLVIAKLAYSNAAEYDVFQTQILPRGNVDGSKVSIGYLFKSQIAPVNKSVTADSVNGVYSQQGINLAEFDLNSGLIDTREIAGSVHITGGFPWMYDGTAPVEHSFFVWPEDLGVTTANSGGGLKRQEYFYAATYEWTDAAGNIHRSAPSIPLEIDTTLTATSPITTTAVFANNSVTLTVASTAGLFIGQVITDTTTPGNFQANTQIVSISGLTVTISLATLGASAVAPGDTIRTVDTFTNTINIPTLRLTYKTTAIVNNNVRIVLYRWSTAQQIFYQVTSVVSPIINDTTIDSIAYIDTQNDASIIGNLIMYTTGGVLENIQAPACSVSTLFKSRWFVVDSEDKNLIWFSKTVIEETPVETTNLQTIFVAPTTGAQGSTGPITALSSMDDKLIIFKKDAIYYVTGNGPDITGANNDYGDPVFITSTIGCSNQRSIVLMPNGLMFQSDKGIWLLGRDMSTGYLGAPVDRFNQNLVVAALTVPGTNQVRFTLEGDTEPTLMYDYYFQQWGEFSGISSLSSTLFQGEHTFINKYGEVFQETEGVYLDGSRPVLMSFTTAWAKLAGLQGFQRAYFFYLLGIYKSPHKLVLDIAYDYDPNPTQQSIISPINWSGVYGEDPIYGGQTPYGGPSSVEQWRVFFERQKCQSFQITLNEIFDPTIGPTAGEGLTLSGINLIYGYKKGYTTLAPSLSVG